LLGGTSLKLAFRQTGAQCLAEDVSIGTFCPILPLTFRKAFFDHFQNVAHRRRLASRRIISFRFVWRGLSSAVTAWARGCLACQRGKIHRHTRLAPQPIPIPQRRFSHLHVDLVGPLQYSNNCNYIFTIIDRTSKWMEACRYVRRGMRKGFNLNLDFPFWRSRNDHFRSQPAIYFKPLI
jgi:hypothetical protein